MPLKDRGWALARNTNNILLQCINQLWTWCKLVTDEVAIDWVYVDNPKALKEAHSDEEVIIWLSGLELGERLSTPGAQSFVSTAEAIVGRS